VDQMEARFPYGAPSLLACERLAIRGDVYFGRDVVLTGEVSINTESDDVLYIPDGAHLEGKSP
ncbi:MAG: UTP--glucose-1-phosphate uridylyltransferase, partial [Candidatus Krumholzibacteriia bacterium]